MLQFKTVEEGNCSIFLRTESLKESTRSCAVTPGFSLRIWVSALSFYSTWFELVLFCTSIFLFPQWNILVVFIKVTVLFNDFILFPYYKSYWKESLWKPNGYGDSYKYLKSIPYEQSSLHWEKKKKTSFQNFSFLCH